MKLPEVFEELPGPRVGTWAEGQVVCQRFEFWKVILHSAVAEECTEQLDIVFWLAGNPLPPRKSSDKEFGLTAEDAPEGRCLLVGHSSRYPALCVSESCPSCHCQSCCL